MGKWLFILTLHIMLLGPCYSPYTPLLYCNKAVLTDRSKAVVLLWFSVTCFGVRVSMTFHLMCVHIIFSSV